MFYIVYKTINVINNKEYIGVHKSKRLNDAYLGSGVGLKLAVLKYGKENFIRENVFVYDNPHDMFDKERELVTEDYVRREDNYNRNIGGVFSMDYINSVGKNHLHGNRENSLKNLELGRTLPKTPEQIAKARNTLKTRYANGEIINAKSFLGKEHSDETKATIGRKNSVHQSGKGNSQYGSMWITNGVKDKKIPKTDDIPEGWNRGRVMNSEESDIWIGVDLKKMKEELHTFVSMATALGVHRTTLQRRWKKLYG